MGRCIVKNCKNYAGKKGSEHVKFFSLPKDPNLLREWVKVSEVEKELNIDNARICSAHFTDGDYKLEHILLNIPDKKKQLKKGALPTQKLPIESTVSNRDRRYKKKEHKQFLEEAMASFENKFLQQENIEWYQWCRLCGKENGNEVNIFVKEEDFYSIAETIHEFFSIQVNDFEDIPKNICSVCNNFLVSLQDFSAKAKKVEKMFLEIDYNRKTGRDFDAYSIRMKYDIESIYVNRNSDCKDMENKFPSQISTKMNGASCKFKTRNTLTNELDEKLINPHSVCGNANEAVGNDLENGNHLIYYTTGMSQEINSDDKRSNESIIEEFKEKINDSDQFDESERESKLNVKLKKQKNIKTFGEEEKKFECEECHMKFIRESNYACHLKKAHNAIKPLLPCNICGKVCKTKQKLKFHMELHLPPEEREKLLFKCPECPQKFTQKGAMRSHVRAQHYFEKPFICEQCGKKFPSQTNLWSHRSSHDDKNHLTCPKCPKIFKNKFRLRVHMRGHNDSYHPCAICGLILKTMKTLKNHMLVHSDAKPFKCNFCGKDFKRDKNLQNHMITHSGLRPFICRFCGQSYANRSNCKKHEKHSHSKEYEEAASITSSEPQQKVVKKLPNIQQLETMLEQIKSDKADTAEG